MPGRNGAAIRTMERSMGTLTTAAIERMEQTLPWYRAMPAENRSWVNLVAQAGIAAFTEWLRNPRDDSAISADVVADLRAGSYDVVGDLDDLLPAPPRDGRTPDDATDEELLAAARTVLTRLGLHPVDTLDEAVAAIADDLRARTARPRGAVAEEDSSVGDSSSGTALGRVLRRLTDQR